MARKIDHEQLTRRTWLAGGLAMAASPLLTACGGGGELELAAAAPDEMLLLKASGPSASDFTANIQYGSQSRHVMDLYRAPSATVASPGPIYIWAHPNGSTYRSNLPSDQMRRSLQDMGVSIISWESEATLTQTNEPTVTADAALMLSYVRANGAALGLDVNRIVLGGGSRGTFASWKIGHEPANAGFIKGMFMKNALPGSVTSTMGTGQTTVNKVANQSPSYWVTANSPLIQFVHVPESQDNFHSAANSTPVLAAYASKGISERASQHIYGSVGGMDDAYLLDFVQRALRTASPVSGINFVDDFNSGFNAANYVTAGSWSVSGGALRQVNTSSYGHCAAGLASWADYTVTARLASPTSLSATDNSQVSRVVARFTDTNNYYEAFVTKNGMLGIQSKKNGIISTLRSVPVTPVAVTAMQTLALTCNGNQLTVSLNGVAQAPISNADHAAGKAGVRSFACETRVDHLAIVGV